MPMVLHKVRKLEKMRNILVKLVKFLVQKVDERVSVIRTLAAVSFDVRNYTFKVKVAESLISQIVNGISIDVEQIVS